ncbi:MAG: nodulation protein NfeD [Candidatus Thermoplasmatota archaeon]|nr:nodulation protein NfeD [Candidatus Thermoplasmatota archaeon]MCL5955432.1 nodulation protein NfeD [Candidatus Thermoplasmatota archaeon]
MKVSPIVFLFILSFVAISFASSSSATTSQNVLVLNLHEEIDPGSSHFISSALAGVNKNNTVAVVIDMNTPGGILQNMLYIINAINATQSLGVPVYTYVPSYGGAASAGSYIALASTAVYMGNSTVIGPSTPIVVGGTSLEQNHTENYFISYMGAIAQENHHNVTAAEIMVSQDTAYTGMQAISNGLVNGYASNLTTFLAKMNLSGYNVITQNPGYYDNFLSFLSNTTVDGLFILVGSIAILADIYHGTAVLTIVGIALIALGLLGAEIVSASLVGLILVMMGAIFIFLEAKTGHGVALISGVIVTLIGTFMLASPYLSSNPGYSPSPFGTGDIVAAVLIAVIAVVVGLLVRRIAISFRAKKFTGSESLIGKTAVVRKAINPMGTVSVEGIQWRARTEDGSLVDSNAKVTVVGREDLVLVVKKQ